MLIFKSKCHNQLLCQKEAIILNIELLALDDKKD